MTDTQTNPSREAILARIRSALTKSAPPCDAVSHEISLFPPVGDVLERVQKELAVNKIECILTADLVSSARALFTTLCSLPGGEVFVQDSPELRALFESGTTEANSLTPRSVRWSTQGSPAEASQATISMAEFLVASTGSIVVSSACGGRGASIIAPCHIVYATTSQIVPDLDAAMAYIEQTGALKNSFIGFISGSSRTGDIEKILVHGAHGPRKVIVILQRS